MADQEAAKARGLIFDYLQLKAKIDHLEAEQAVLKNELAGVMAQMGLETFDSPDGVARTIVKHTYAFDVPTIITVVPTIVSKLKLSNDDYNKFLVGNEAKLATCRTVLRTDRTLTISVPKQKK